MQRFQAMAYGNVRKVTTLVSESEPSQPEWIAVNPVKLSPWKDCVCDARRKWNRRCIARQHSSRSGGRLCKLQCRCRPVTTRCPHRDGWREWLKTCGLPNMNRNWASTGRSTTRRLSLPFKLALTCQNVQERKGSLRPMPQNTSQSCSRTGFV